MPFINQLFQLQSRFAPIPLTIHVAFCIFATLLFTVLYIRQRKIADFLWLIACDIPIILHWYGDAQTAYTVLGCEIVLLFLIFIEWLKERKAKKEAKAQDSEAHEAKTAENTETTEADEDSQDAHIEMIWEEVCAEEKSEEAIQETEKAEATETAEADEYGFIEMTWEEVYGEGKSVDPVDLERLDKEFDQKCKENAKAAKKNLAQPENIEVVLDTENVFTVEIPENEEK